MIYFGNLVQFLPNDMYSFVLNMSGNTLGENIQNLKYLVEGLKQLPENL